MPSQFDHFGAKAHGGPALASASAFAADLAAILATALAATLAAAPTTASAAGPAAAAALATAYTREPARLALRITLATGGGILSTRRLLLGILDLMNERFVVCRFEDARARPVGPEEFEETSRLLPEPANVERHVAIGALDDASGAAARLGDPV